MTTYCSVPKGTFWAKAMSNSEKIKPVALAIIELRLSECISQSVSRKQRFLKFCSNFLKAFRVDLKACLGLNNITPSLSGKTEAGFWVILLRRLRLLLHHLYYELLLWFMIYHMFQQKHIETHCIKLHVPHKKFTHVLIISLHTEAKLESIKPIIIPMDSPVCGK